MVYLAIMVVVAAIGISRLMIQQKRERASYSTVDGFRTSLERISAPSEKASRKGTSQRRSGMSRSKAARVPLATGPSRHRPLDPERRAAAKKRIEERRRSQRRVAV